MPAARWAAGLRAQVVHTFPGGAHPFSQDAQLAVRGGSGWTGLSREKRINVRDRKRQRSAWSAGHRGSGICMSLSPPLTATFRGLFTS